MTKFKSLSLIFASAALTAAIVLPAWSAMKEAAEGNAATRLTSLFGSDEATRPMILADSDDHDDEEAGAAATRRASDEDEEACDEDEGSCKSSARAPAPAGSVAPPQNGLFGTTPPKVQVQ